jgi:hypothetical protein
VNQIVSFSRGRWCYDFGMIILDELAKIMAAPIKRRNALRLAAKVLIGGALASLVVGQTIDTTCKNGTFRCKGQGFDECAHGKWVFFKCPPGTECRPMAGGTIVCEPPREN